MIVSAKFPSWLESVQGDTDNTSNVDVIFSEQQAMHTVAEEPPVIMPLQTWGANPGGNSYLFVWFCCVPCSLV